MSWPADIRPTTRPFWSRLFGPIYRHFNAKADDRISSLTSSWPIISVTAALSIGGSLWLTLRDAWETFGWSKVTLLGLLLFVVVLVCLHLLRRDPARQPFLLFRWTISLSILALVCPIFDNRWLYGWASVVTPPSMTWPRVTGILMINTLALFSALAHRRY